MSVFAIRKPFVDWVAGALGLTAGHVVWGDQDGPKPTKPFVKLKMSAYHQIGWPVILPPDDNGHAVVVTQNDFTLSIQYFADPTRDAIEELLKLQNSLWQEDKIGRLRTARIAFRTVLMGPTDICQVVDTAWESRGAMDLLMSSPFCTEDTQQGFISSSGIDGVIMNGSSTINEFEIEIDTPSITANP